ncbi:ABC transporter permease [Limnoglobus roseus]|uniref:Polysaccharide ABC transporter permease n=1 Tax=Limnoglobus roseus TaxID=2598579 RepID=A0A5C1AD80_9BACT|nr:ABC transporter permease [Limnoglobus roseus]QEL16107.1 polysaccharide ABC transporter permease [Limnoglobus roseus]
MIQHLKQVWQFRYFWGSLVQLDFRNRYRRSLLGIGWSMLNPLAMTVVFCIAFGTIMGVADWRDFAPFLLAGLAVWNFIKESLLYGCDAFVRGESYIRQAPLPFSIYPLRIVLGTFIHFMISLVLVVVTVMVLKGSTDVLYRLVAVIPAVLLLVVFCWSIATISAFAGAYFHDTKHLVEIGTQLLFFLTPIMYKPTLVVEKIGPWMLDLNPAAQFLMVISHPLADGSPVPPDAYFVLTTLTTALFGLACCTMAWLQKRLIFQL